MKIAVAAMENALDGDVADRFGRCPWFLIVDSESMEFEGFENPAANLPGGAGPTAVQSVVDRGAEVLIASELGPKAQQAAAAAGIRAVVATGSIREAISQLNK